MAGFSLHAGRRRGGGLQEHSCRAGEPAAERGPTLVVGGEVARMLTGSGGAGVGWGVSCLRREESDVRHRRDCRLSHVRLGSEDVQMWEKAVDIS